MEWITSPPKSGGGINLFKIFCIFLLNYFQQSIFTSFSLLKRNFKTNKIVDIGSLQK